MSDEVEIVQCEARTGKGVQCTRPPLPGMSVCGHHKNSRPIKPLLSTDVIESWDLSSAKGRLDALEQIARETRSNAMDAATAQALVACIRQASKQTGAERRTAPKVVFATATTRTEADRILELKEQAETAS